MKLLPPAGPERTRLLAMIGALALLALAYYKWGGTTEFVQPALTGPPAPVVRTQAQPRPGVGRPGAVKPPSTPQPLRLAEMEQVPDEPIAGRNLFRFGVKPPPPPPPYVAPPPQAYVPPPAPVPQGPPPIPLKVTLIIGDPYEPARNRAYLLDPKSQAIFEAVEGQVVDGRYKLLKVGTSSVVMSYLDGTGQRTINVGG